jgi:hypothetical protein
MEQLWSFLHIAIGLGEDEIISLCTIDKDAAQT